MRRIHTFHYFNKTFQAGDLTVGNYWLYLQSPEEALYAILKEFNKNVPKLTQGQSSKFQDILFGCDDDDDERRRKMLRVHNTKKTPEQIREDLENFEKDFHIEVGAFCRFMSQQYDSVMAMPLWVFRRMSKDAKIISGDEKMVKDRHKKTLDSAGLKKALKTS